MYCTGGIRCEKASAFLKKDGYKNIVQLDGGVINYLNYKKKSKQNLFGKVSVLYLMTELVNKELKEGSISSVMGVGELFHR